MYSVNKFLIDSNLHLKLHSNFESVPPHDRLNTLRHNIYCLIAAHLQRNLTDYCPWVMINQIPNHALIGISY